MNLNGTNNHTVCLPSCLSFSNNKKKQRKDIFHLRSTFLVLSNEVVFSKGRLSPDGTASRRGALNGVSRWVPIGFLSFRPQPTSQSRPVFTPKWAGPKREPPPVNEKGCGSTTSSYQPPGWNPSSASPEKMSYQR